MTTPSSAHAPSSWRGDPERDFVNYQLIEMARHVLDEYFTDDERVAEYQAPGRRTKGRKQKVASSKPEALKRWHGTADSTLVLRLARPMPTARQGLGMPQSQSARLPAPCLHPPHVAKAMQSKMMFPDRL
jgi:hypothetical protein